MTEARARTVLFLHSSSDLYGSDLQLLTLASGLDRGRYRPLAVLPERGKLVPLLEDAGVETLVRPLAVLRRGLLSVRGAGQLSRRLLADGRELSRLARERRASVVHSNTSAVLAGQRVARRAGAIHVMHVREIYSGLGDAWQRLWPAYRRRLLRADALVCISSAVAAQFAGSERVSLVHEGLGKIPEPAPRPEARRALGLPPEPYVVALVGRISDWKGHDVLARALVEAPLREIGAIGIVAGDAFHGEERHERALRELSDRLGLRDRLRLLGFRDELGTVLGAADAVAVPSTRPEPLGNAALEAAAAGMPVIAAAHGGLLDIIRHEQTGLLVPPRDPAALAAAARRLAEDPAGARAMGEAAARDVRLRFDRQKMLAGVQACYDRLLGAR